MKNKNEIIQKNRGRIYSYMLVGFWKFEESSRRLERLTTRLVVLIIVLSILTVALLLLKG